jgi:hypothetical protein
MYNLIFPKEIYITPNLNFQNINLFNNLLNEE